MSITVGKWTQHSSQYWVKWMQISRLLDPFQYGSLVHDRKCHMTRIVDWHSYLRILIGLSRFSWIPQLNTGKALQVKARNLPSYHLTVRRNKIWDIERVVEHITNSVVCTKDSRFKCTQEGYVLWLQHIFQHHLIKGTIFGKKLLNSICGLWFSLQLLFETFLIPRRIQRDIVMSVETSSCKVPVMLVGFSPKTQTSNFFKICPVGIELLHADRQVDGHTWRS